MSIFVHLNIHSEYSLVDGIVRIGPLIEQAKASSIPALALTDQMNLFAAVKFYKAATKAGIKPLFGADLRILNPEQTDKPFHATALCMDNAGYLNLTALISKAYTDGQATGYPLIEKSWLDEHNAGLIILSGDKQGDVGQALLNDNQADAEAYLTEWQEHFPNRFYIAISRTGHAQESDYLKRVLPMAAAFNVPVIATNQVRFMQADDFDAHETRVAIHDGYVLIDPKRPKLYSTQQYFRSAKEMQSLFADIPTAITNTVEIAKRCNVSLDLDTYYLPDFPVPEGITMDRYFADVAEKGLEQRLAILLDKNDTNYTTLRAPYDDRLAEEIKVISKMGYAGYFLIVADFIQWAKQQDIPVGPGRGSGAGSLIAYAMQITDLDPLEYELLFERFLNPERVSMPDFDIDFCMDGRDRVIEYVANKYGRDCVSQIITYGTMAAKAVVRDVGRVLSHPYGFVDKIAKLIPFEIGMTLQKALAQEEALLARYNEEEEVRALIDLAQKLEGITRNAGKHAGGVVIAPSKLSDFCALYCEQDSPQIVTQFDKDDVESIGLVKFDFLGLRTLTIIHWAVQTVNHRLQKEGKPSIDISLIPVDDSKPYDLLKECATTAVFQLESRGMKDLIKRLQPDCFEEIIALVALFRPGPLQSGMVDDFIDRKHGRASVEYPHPDLEVILSPTYGVILYQEQVMQIAQVLAGYTLGGADLLRRAMGKKKPEEMAKQRKIFVEGATKRGVEAKTATHIFDLMEKFAGYGFNKSHSAAYALVAYQTAWLKAHYPAEFMAAVLSSDMDNTDKMVNFVNECKSMQLTLQLPSINVGFYKFTVNDAGEILYGLGAIKGVGEGVIENIVAARESGVFTDLFDLCHRIDIKKCNKRVFQALIKSGAFDCFDQNRATLSASMEKALASAGNAAMDHVKGQGNLFGLLDEATQQSDKTYLLVEPWPMLERLAGEKATLGYYVSGHPLNQYKHELKQLARNQIASLTLNGDQRVTIAGMITSIRFIQTKRGDKMAFVGLEDQTGTIDLAVFSDVIQESRELLEKDNIVIVEGEVSEDDFNGGVRMSCKRLLSLEQIREQYAKYMLIKVKSTDDSNLLNEQLANLLTPFKPGACPVRVAYEADDYQVTLVPEKSWRVSPNSACLAALSEYLDEASVEFVY